MDPQEISQNQKRTIKTTKSMHFPQYRSLNKLILFIATLLICLGLFIGAFLTRNDKQPMSAAAPTINPTIILSDTPTIIPTSALFPNYRVFTASRLGFTIDYPSNIIPDLRSEPESNETVGVTFTFEGETKMNEEMGIPFSDGYKISIYYLPTSDPLHDYLSFEEVVQKEIDSVQAYDNIIKPQSNVAFAGISGIQFVSARTIHKLEVTTHYILQTNDGRILKINYMFLDPTNRGYKNTVEQILSTFKLTNKTSKL